MLGTRNMRWGGATTVVALIAGMLVFAGLLQPTASASAAPGGGSFAPLVAGQPGIPSDPDVLYQEDFQNVQGRPLSAVIPLQNYQSVQGVTYTADPFWLDTFACNGFILNYQSAQPPGYCNNASDQFGDALAKTYALGLLNSPQNPTTNWAASSNTAGAGPNNQRMFVSSLLNVPANGRFITFSVDSAATACQAIQPKLRFSLVTSGGQLVPVSNGPINPCTNPNTQTATVSAPGTTPQTVWYGNFAADSSILFNSNQLGVSMVNEEGSGAGNDGAFDNIRVLDVTPQLDKAFSPTSVPVGGVSTLTFTVTNTSELASKSGWSFTDTLPTGLVVAGNPNLGGTCDATTTAAAGATSISIANGNLATGEVSCTVTVDVTSSTPLPSEPTPKTYTNCAANITAVVGLDLPNCASVTFHSTNLVCTAPTVYGTNQGTGDGDLWSINAATGAATKIVDLPGSNIVNQLGIAPGGGSFTYTKSGVIYNHTLSTGTSTSAPMTTMTGYSQVGGAVNPVNGLFYYGGIGAGGTSYQIGVYDPATNTTLGIAATIQLPAGVTIANSDFAFDNLGQLYIVGAVGNAPGNIIRVDGSVPATGANAALTSTRLTTIPAVANVSYASIAFASNGELYIGGGQRVLRVNATTGAILSNNATTAGGDQNFTDFATCGAPPTLTVQKSVEGRVLPTDQFALAITGSGIVPGPGNRGVTQGTENGVQNQLPAEVAGAVIVQPNATYDFAETASGTTELTNYVSTWECVNANDPTVVLASGSGAAGNVTIPAVAGIAVLCTISNAALNPDLQITKTSTATADSRVGDVVEYTVSATNNGTGDYTAANPAVVFDDLSGVLDDATYNGDAASDRGGAPSYAAPLLSWSGALDAGDTVTLTYSVTLAAGGDGTARNVAWVPEDPSNPQAPACDPPVDGTDPTTGEPCAFTSLPLPRLSIDKSADRTELPAVGDQVTYTVVVTNEGPGDYTATAPATSTDDLSEVLDDATFDDASLTSDVGEVTRSGDTLSWTGPLAAGASATITYTVTYTGDGDNVLRNRACVPEEDVAPGFLPCDVVRIPGAALQQWKTAAPSSNPVVAGSTITYTLFFDNDGQAGATIDAVDDLTHVLDDAEVTTEPTSADGLTVVRNGAEISITGTVPAGERYTVSYTVTVLPDDERGDSIASNFLLAPGEEPPTDPECVPTDADFPNCTTTPITGVAYTKAVTASETPVVEGTELTYTITVRNTGATVVDVVRDDDLTGVLDDADLTTAPASDTASVTLDGPTDGILAIRGDLAVGATATITYTVTVKAQSERGDNTANNFLVPPGTTPPAECDPETDQCTSTPIQGYTVSKTADIAVANPGSVVTYTVTVVNTGTVDFTDADPVAFTDDLTEVLDDAVYNGDVTAGGSVTGNTLTWAGPLAAGATVTITYSVTVNDPVTGDQVLTNAVVPTVPGGECDPEGECIVETPIASFTVAKAADVATALPGDVVTYTVTVTNTGTADYTADAPASFTDDLTAVLDDATYNGDVSTGGAVTGNTLTWSGALAVDQTVEVTYSVTVNDPITGDKNLLNTITPTSPGGTCTADDECATSTPVGSYTVAKEASAASVLPGDVVTYTVTVTNTSEVDYTDARPATFTDDLSGVLDDAVYNDDVSAGGSVTGPTLTWSGALPAGESVTVTYSVTVDSPVTGDFVLRNAVTPTGPGGSCTAEGECETETPVSALRVVKSTESTEVLPGGVVEYTIAITNTGQVDYTDAAPASFTDDLSGVLDDAAYNGDVTSSTGAGAAYAAPVLSWSGPLAIGDTVTVTYSVTVNDPATGDDRLENTVVTPPGVGGNCEPGSTDPACVANVPSGSYTVEKTADPPTALPGDVVTYTVTVTNTGEVAYTDEDPASFSDDLSRVLDDAAYNGDVSPGGAVSGTTLTWSGALAVGESLQVTYSVTVDDPVEGDFTLRNVVAPTSPGGECVEGACIIDTPIASYTVNKTSDVVDTVLGGVVTYSVTVSNIGQVDYTDAVPATFSDDLSGVLDDATYNGDASNGATVVGNTLDWSGALPIGETVTVTYSVTVNQPGTGDRRLLNAVLPTGPGGSCAEAGDCETDTPIASYRVIKTVSTEQATIGDRVTFTITVSNTGQVPYTAERPASFTDDLTSALQVATYNDDATGGAVYSEPVLSWAGDLDVGDVRAITYSVTVTKVGEIRNVVVTPDGSGANCSVGSEDPDCMTLTRIVPPLALTGGELWWAGGIAGATFLALGLWLTVRRRRDTVGATADI